jgi:calcineurin-like phosphoesterase family protein
MARRYRCSRPAPLRHDVLWIAALLVAACTVADQTGPNSDITELQIVPTSVATAASQTVQFKALGRTASGGTRAVQVSWSATGGTIAGTGTYVSDSTVGDYEVTATLDSPHLTAHAQVRVRGALKQIVLLPGAATVAPGGQVQFSDYGMTSNGDSVAVSPTYSATGGSISSDGMFTAGQTAGTFAVIATAVTNKSGNTVADTAPITISGTAPTLAQLVLTPAAATLNTGASQQFATYGKLSNGDSVAVSVGYSAPGGSITSAGLYTAGQSPGTFRVIATQSGGSLADTSSVTVVASSGSVVLVGAGDISDCGNDNDEATATLLDGIAGTVYTLGDNVYSSGTATEFSQCYDPTWGRHKTRTKPAPGNHDYNTSGATGYYGYFGDLAGPAGRGYYSYDLGAWHLISLNSEVSMSAGSAQETWLRADLGATSQQCILAYWHKPRFSSGTDHGSLSSAQPLWQALYDFHADIVLGGHEHNYERFAPQTPAGVADPANGIREFVVGTGGESHYNDEGTPLPNSELFNGTTFGVLKLTLGAGSYGWQFIPVAGQSFTDSGSGTCH